MNSELRSEIEVLRKLKTSGIAGSYLELFQASSVSR
jgi:hypothetical protein